MFEFNQALDADYLEETYESDLTMINILFSTFLEDTLPIWDQIGPALQQGNLAEAASLTHQVKPTFAMVALTVLYGKVIEFKQQIKAEEAPSLLLNHYADLSKEIEVAEELIKSENERIETEL
jgi:hypothetical protein